MARCENCGCSMSGGFCTNCDEEVFIADQYRELDIPLPSEDTDFMKRYNESMGTVRQEEKRNPPKF